MKKYVVLAVVVALVSWWGINSRFRELANAKVIENIDMIKEKEGIPVRTVEPRFLENVDFAREFTGTIEAFREVTVSAHLAEEVVKSDLVLGKHVKAGEVLVILRSDMLNAEKKLAEASVMAAQASLDKVLSGARPQELEQAKANARAAQARLKNAREEYERMSELVKQNAIPKQKADQIVAAYEGAKAAMAAASEGLSLVEEGARDEDVRSARAACDQAAARLEAVSVQLGFTEISSPIDGVISVIEKEVGEQTGVGKPVFTVVDLDKVFLVAEVPEMYINRIGTGMKALCRAGAVTGVTFEGLVAEICPSASPLNRVFSVKIAVDNPDSSLKPGMFGSGSISIDRVAKGCVIPRYCLSVDRDKTFIFVVENGLAKQTIVTFRDLGGDLVAIEPHLQPKTAVIADGTRDVRDGSRIRAEGM